MGYEWLGIVLERLQGIEPHEVMQALDPERRRWPRPAVSVEGIRVLTVWGRTAQGRPLVVGLRPLGGVDWLIVGARDMRPKELAEFEEWEASDEQ